MKFVSTMALGVVLALGATATVGVAPAVAKEKAAKPGKGPNLSQPVRAALVPAQDALAKGDFAAAMAGAQTAKAAATTPDDKYYASTMMYQAASKLNDNAKISEAVDGMVDSGAMPAEQAAQVYALQGKLAYTAKNMAKAEQALALAQQAGSTDPDVAAILVDSKARAGKPAEALALLQTSIDKQRAAGQKVPSEWYQRGVNIAYTAKLPDQSEALTQEWLGDYSTPTNWRDSLIIYRDTHKLDADYSLDLMRLMRTAKALKGERDYSEYAEAVYLKYPGEGKSLIDEGVANGMVKLTPNGNFKMMSDTAGKRMAADKVDLASAAKSATTARSAAATADSYLGYGDYANAITLYNTALTKGGVDADMINTRLGMAQVLAGQKDAAKATFAKINGPRKALAKYWMIYIDHPPVAA